MNCCFDRLIRLRVESETVEVVLREVGQNGLVDDHAKEIRTPARVDLSEK
jgi:hypothetical protein